jgi:hypothetical protein
MKDFFKKFDRKRFLFVTKIVFIFVGLLVVIRIIGRTYTRYESNVDINANANVAFFIIDQGTYESTIALDGLVPSPNPIYYTFYVANYKDSKRSKVDMDYNIKFETTTNLPLTYEIIRNQTFEGPHTNIIDTNTVRQDSNNVYYRVFTDNDTYSFGHSSNQTDQYVLKVTFPASYKDYPDLYQGVIELFSIIIDAHQVT